VHKDFSTRRNAMLTPHVTEILPPWRTARSSSRIASNPATVAQRDLVIASLIAEGGRGDVYPRGRRTGRDRPDRRI
jgi:hypothetical protein